MAVKNAQKNIIVPNALKACIQAIDDKKAEAISIIYVGAVSSITDFLVVATGTSNPHLKAIAGTIEATLKEFKMPVIRSGSAADSGWYVVDGFEFMIHIFTPDMREFYSLEALWKDGEPVNVAELLS